MVGGSLLGSTGTQAQSDMTQQSANSVSERKTAELSSGPTVEEQPRRDRWCRAEIQFGNMFITPFHAVVIGAFFNFSHFDRTWGLQSEGLAFRRHCCRHVSEQLACQQCE